MTRRGRLALGVVVATISALSAAGAASADEPDARRFYVSPTGSDASQGNVDRPFRTLERARDAVREAGRWARETDGAVRRDIFVEIEGGTYRLDEPLTLDARDSGTREHPVVWEAASSDPVVISGGRRITGWTQSDADRNIWAADVPAGLDTRQLYVDGTRAVRARSTGGLPGVSQTSYGYTTTDSSIATWPDAGDLEFVYRSTWIEPRCGVDHVTGDEVHMDQPCFDNSTKPGRPGVLAGLPVYMENAYELLDQPGEWYLDRRADKLYYIPRAGEDMATADVEAPVLQTLVNGDGTADAPVHDVHFKGLTFSYATWLRPNDRNGFSEVQANFTVLGEHPSPSGDTPDFGSFPQTPANVTFAHGHGIRFERDTFAHLGAVGLGLGAGSQDDTVVASTFTDISGSGMQLGDTDPSPEDPRDVLSDDRVADNYIHDVAAEYHGGVGIWVGYTQRAKISHNLLTDLPYSGISIGWGWGYVDNVARDNEVTDNLIHHHLQLLSDGAAIYSNGIQRGERISGNVMHDQRGLWGVLGLDNGSRYNTVVNNVGWRNPYGISLNDNYGDVVVRHNFTDRPILNSPGPQTGTDGAAPSVIADNPIVSDPHVMPASIVGRAGLEPAYADLSPTPPPSDTTAPTAPTDARVTGRTSSSVVLAWDAATDDAGVTGYEVDQDGVAISASAPSPDATAIITGLEPDHTYTFDLHARDAAANLSPAATVTVTTRPAPTVPSELPADGLKLWLSSDELDGAPGDQVALWGDQSGTGHDVVQTAAGAQPTLVADALNGKPALRFDGSTDWLATSAPISSSRAYTVFAVSTVGTSASGPFYNGNSAGDGYGFYRFTPGRYGIVHGGLRGEVFGPILDTGFQLDTMARGDDAMVHFYVNGTESGTAVPGTPNPPSGATYVGAVNPFTGGFFGGDVAEIVVYDRGLSDAERDQVTDYLKAKYGL